MVKIPGYAGYVIYQKILLPYLFRGQSPFASLQGLARGSNAQPEGAPQQQEAVSKRQQKLQARAAKGDPRVQVRKRYIGDRNSIIATRTSGQTSSARSLVYADGVLLSNLLGNRYDFPPRWNMVCGCSRWSAWWFSVMRNAEIRQ